MGGLHVAAEAPAGDFQGMGWEELGYLILPQLPPHRLPRVVPPRQGSTCQGDCACEHRGCKEEARRGRDGGYHNLGGRLEELRGWICGPWCLHQQLGCAKSFRPFRPSSAPQPSSRLAGAAWMQAANPSSWSIPPTTSMPFQLACAQRFSRQSQTPLRLLFKYDRPCSSWLFQNSFPNCEPLEGPVRHCTEL